VLDVAQALRVLGRNQEALDLLDRVVAQAQTPDAQAQFDDIADQLNWLLNEKAYALYELNRPEEARTAFGLSIAVGEDGQWSVSQVINFASMLQAEGRSADALEVVQTVGEASPYGRMWVAAVRACAAGNLGRAELRREALAYLREHERDNAAARANALLCVNDLDEAAALYIRRLANPAEREDALLALQTYRRPPRPALPQESLLHARLEQVRGRPDVLAAVAAVGRIEEAPLHSVYWGDV
jgi:tetratricopeptide (TPR) repeat protein